MKKKNEKNKTSKDKENVENKEKGTDDDTEKAEKEKDDKVGLTYPQGWLLLMVCAKIKAITAHSVEPTIDDTPRIYALQK